MSLSVTSRHAHESCSSSASCCSDGSVGYIETRHVSDTWKCGSLICISGIFTHPSDDFKKRKRANDSTGYTLVEPRHIRVPFLYRHYTHAADWPAPHFTPFRRGSASVYPAASFFVPNWTLLLRTCTLIRREIAGNKTLPPDHGITRHNKPQRPPDHGHNTA